MRKRRSDKSNWIQCEGRDPSNDRRCMKPEGHKGDCRDSVSYVPPKHFKSDPRTHEQHAF